MLSNKMKFQKESIKMLPKALEMLKEAAQWLREKETDQWSFWLDPPTEKIAWIKEGFEKEQFYFVYLEDDLIGMFRLMYFDDMYWGHRDERFDTAAYVHSLTIQTAYKGRNMGAEVLKRIEKMLVAQGIFKFRLDCMQSNQSLCAYYEQQGFLKVGEVKMSWAMQNLYEKKLEICFSHIL